MSEQTRYFLPQSLHELLDAPIRSGEITAEDAVIKIDGFKIPGFVLKATDEGIAKFVAVITEAPQMKSGFRVLVTGEGLINDVAYSILGITPVVACTEEEGNGLIRFENLLEEVEELLSDLSKWSGLFINYTAPQREALQPPQLSSGEIMVVFDGAPPGESNRRVGEKICGVRVSNKEGTQYRMLEPTKGYKGIIVRDEDDQPVAQIIGRTFYLFPPINPLFNWSYFAKGPDVMRKVLRLAWNAFVSEEAMGPEQMAINDADSYVAAFNQYSLGFQKRIEGRIAETNERLDQVEAEYKDLLSTRRVLGAAKAEVSRVNKSADRNEWKKEWGKISSSPFTAHIAFVDDGIQIETIPLVSEPFEGVCYQYSSFIIRFGERESVFVRASDHFGPKGQVHPHISASGRPCFGNIGMAIEEAIFEQRLADAYEMVVRWLVEGYDHDHAGDAKITEWPVAEGKEVAHA